MLAEMITIGSGDATVRIEAARGGRIAALDVGGQELLVGPAPGRGPMNWGSFPMVPWAGRIRRGQFSFDGRNHQLPLDLPPHAIHGTAYRQEWDVGDVTDDEMTMGCDLTWALGGRAWQRVEVGESRLTCALAVVAGDDAMPAEIGWHPWFVKPHTLSFRPASMYLRDDEGIPTGELVPPPAGPWDDCFINTELVELHYTALTVTVTSDCDHWVVYDAPSHATCVEPQSGPPDAFNLSPRLLQPGERLSRTMTIQWIDKPLA